MKAMWIAAIAALASGFAFAAEYGGVKFEEKVNVNGQELVLNGGGVRSRFIVKVYAAGLYLPQKSSNPATIIHGKGPRRIQLTMLRDLSADQFADALKDGLDNNATQAELDAIKGETEQLLGIMRSLKEAKSGQTIAIDFGADGKTTISVNGAASGSVQSEALQKALLKIWLGDKPVQNDLKKGLLGQ